MQRKTGVLFSLALLYPLPALPQPAPRPTETVTVTGVKPTEKAIDDFLMSHTAPTRVLGKIARWKTAICPITTGLGV